MMLKNLCCAVLSISPLAALQFAVAAQAADCPSADTVQDGFALEGRSVRSEVHRSAGPVTRVVNTYSDHPKQTVFFFRGLIQLFTTSRASQTAWHLLADLDALFPLERGDRFSLEYVSMMPDQVPEAPRTLELQVTGDEKVSLGKCRYDVLVIRHVVKNGEDPVDEWSALYSPEIEMTLAKRYDEGTAREATIGYSNIHPLPLP